MASNRGLYFDAQVVGAATKVVDDCIEVVLSNAGRHFYFVLRAVAGAGKTEAVIRLAREARRRGVRLAVTSPTNEQVFQTLRRLLTALPDEIITYVPASRVKVPSEILSNVRIRVSEAKHVGDCGLLVGTLKKLGDALSRGDLVTRDLLIIDEAYQADAASYFQAADLAPTHFLVGDSGQLEPFSSAKNPNLFRGIPHDPLQTAVGVLRRHGTLSGESSTVCTYRLNSAATALVRPFYPGVDFNPAVLEDVRSLRLTPVRGKGVNALYDNVLDLSAHSTLAHLELRGPGIPDDDPEVVGAIAGLVRRFFDRAPSVRCERMDQLTRVAASAVAVIVSHRQQRAAMRAALSDAGLPGVFVETANKSQGLEFSTVFYWHALSGLMSADPFHLDPGRTCVGLTRHRHVCIIIGREGDRDILRRFPPTTPSYPDWDSDPLLDGWDIHRQIFASLDSYRVAT